MLVQDMLTGYLHEIPEQQLYELNEVMYDGLGNPVGLFPGLIRAVGGLVSSILGPGAPTPPRPTPPLPVIGPGGLSPQSTVCPPCPPCPVAPLTIGPYPIPGTFMPTLPNRMSVRRR